MLPSLISCVRRVLHRAEEIMGFAECRPSRNEFWVGNMPTLPGIGLDTKPPHVNVCFMGGDYAPFEEPGRKHPARGVYVSLGQPTIVYLTVCTKDRQPWLAQLTVHDALRKLWMQADAWLVGEYILMPDHLHLFCAPRDLTFTLHGWVTHWKRKFSCLHLPNTGVWQRDFWDTRLRRGEKYTEKWNYVRENPVRAGLVQRPEDWPHQGRVNVLPW